MMKVFRANLSTKSIKNMQKALLQYKEKELQAKMNLFLLRLAELGVDVAKLQIRQLDAVFTGELLESIHTEFVGSTKGTAIFYVVADSEHAVFVEFGTGQVGQESPYPYPFPPGANWDYNSGQKIVEIAPGKYGWFYERDGQVWFTQGMPSRPFMYEAGIQIMLNVERVAREVFG